MKRQKAERSEGKISLLESGVQSGDRHEIQEHAEGTTHPEKLFEGKGSHGAKSDDDDDDNQSFYDFPEYPDLPEVPSFLENT
jgi:hypothetical protein